MGDWNLWFEFCYFVTRAAALHAFSFRTEGGRHMPPRGPVLVIANHQSYLDPVLVGHATRRHLRFLARKTLFKNPLLGRLLSSVNVYPVDHTGVATEGLRSVLDLLAAGRSVLIFPEGTRTRTGAMQPFRPGIQLLMRRSLAPVLPVGVAGSFDAFPRTSMLPKLAPLAWSANRATIAVSVGRPLDPRPLLELPRDALLDVLFQKVQEMQLRAERLRRKS